MTQLQFGILSTSSIAPRFIAAVRAADAGSIAAVSSRTLEKAKDNDRVIIKITRYDDFGKMSGVVIRSLGNSENIKSIISTT